ncbi:MAG: TetR/AcrR family transcriptional regulator [Deltaproteobacteria bacterium]|jgi:AcrR family transcriptional regulator
MQDEMASGGSARKPYHHGNLREALIDGAIAIIQEQDIAAVSLRKVARQIGVTNAAPYHHFANKTALLSAVAAEGFRVLVERGTAAIEAEASPRAQLNALGMTYLSVAIEHPAHYQVMFRSDLHQADCEDLECVSGDAFGMLVGIIDRLREELGAEGDVLPVTLSTWSMVHGFATLWTQGALEKKTGIEDWSPLAQHILRMLGDLVMRELEAMCPDSGHE